MRVNFGAKTWLYPMPVLIVGTYDKSGNANAMNAAWGGISEENEISICIDSGHQTARNVVVSGAFTVGVADVKNCVAADYVGLVSGKNVSDKTTRCGWTSVKSEWVNAPIFEQLPFVLECKVKSYDEETCRLVGEIVNVSIDDSILTDGKVDMTKFLPLVYDPIHHTYIALGQQVGKAFSDGKTLK